MSIDFFIDKYILNPKPQDLGKLALLCNQTSFSFSYKRYLHELLLEKQNLITLFVPEHGFFSEWQDQIGLDDTKIYQNIISCPVLSLYQSKEEKLYPPVQALLKIDTLLVDIQDVGSRYYTFANTLSYIFSVIAKHSLNINVFIIERENPAGNFIEGVPLTKKYESFVGSVGLPHRHGLTIGELALYYKSYHKAKFNLNVVLDPNFSYVSEKPSHLSTATEIFPSPNMPHPNTPLVYSGQCLLEGTNLSEGRGTTRPFEIFGAPYLKYQKNVPQEKGAYLRFTSFIPSFHKFASRLCYGFQIHLYPKDGYHSLGHTLQILRWIQDSQKNNFEWKKGIYEFCSEKSAIEILVGNDILLSYLYGKESLPKVKETLAEGEEEWLKITQDYIIHKRKLKRVSCEK